jgi:uncharacterized membrane protein (Fun14 family)
MSETERPDEKPALSTFGKVALALIAVVLLGSIGARALVGSGPEPSADTFTGAPAGGSAFLPSQTPGAPGEAPRGQAEGEGWARALPFLTEASFFALIGFALGYTSRKVVKLGLILLAVTFVVLQGLAFAGVIEIDWQQALDWANRLILNVRENEALSQVVQHRIPSAGAFGGGWLLGMKSG